MQKLVECVPNFSEGRDLDKVKKIADAIRAVLGVHLLSVEPDSRENRTVVTFVGEPEAVKEAAFLAIAVAAEVIDMSLHTGEHPRLGACDVCPFVPLQNVTMAECVVLARQLGSAVAEKLGIPVYLYEEAATRPERKNLSAIRPITKEGQYEGLERRFKDPQWKPDFGEPIFNRKSGATIIGARPFLIAYNVNLATEDTKVGEKIAGIIRESGRLVKREGRSIRIPGCLKALKAFGLKDIAQVSMNLTDFRVTPLHIAYECVSALARLASVDVLDSEIVGLVPEEAMMDAGRFYLAEGQCKRDLVEAAIRNLKLRDFQPEKKIIEWAIKEEENDR